MGADDRVVMDATLSQASRDPRGAPPTAGEPPPVAPATPARPGSEGPYPNLVTVDSSHYTILKEVRTGGMGRIQVAKDRRLDRSVAIKEVLSDSGELARRFEREARLTARLQHPSIVAVHEAGRWSSGAPFYAMPYIEGESLDEVLGRTASLEGRLALVPHVLAVADAMAYAHRHQIIHRDLKPRNVMIGPFGETIVIDWGLAKDLRDGPDEACADTASSAGTVHGAVLGTPAYMAPEQAHGPDVDERADAYALGAILYEVLAGQPPYRGASAEDVLAQVRSGPPAALRARVPGVPVDLAAIVAKAMARDPAERYPSARELADDLRRFQTGLLVTARHHSAAERLLRWMRRHRVILASAAAVVAITAVVATLAFRRVADERDRASAQRNLAVGERAAAEGLVDYVVVDLRRELGRLGRLEPLFGAGTRVGDYYAALDPLRADRDPEAMRRRAQAFEVVGDVQDARGEHEAAATAYRAGLELRRALLRDDPGPRPRVDVVRTLTRIAQAVMDVRRGDATSALAEARRIAEPLQAGPLAAETGVAIAKIFTLTGAAELAHDELAAARDDYRRALDVLARSQPQTDRELRATLAMGHEGLGEAASRLGDRDGALAEFTSQLEIQDRLLADEPVPARRAYVEIAHDKVARALGALGRRDEAERHYLAALEIARLLVQIDPTNIDWLHAVASDASDYGTALLVRKDLAGAQAAFREAYDAIVRVAGADHDHQRWQRHVAVALSKLGQVKEERGDLAGALADYQRTAEILTRAVALDPQQAVARQHLAIAYSYIGEVHRARKDLPAALAAFQAMVDTVKLQAESRDAHAVDFTKILAVARGMLASAYDARGELDRAAGELDQAIATLERLRGEGHLDAEGDEYLGEFRKQRAALARRTRRGP
ncbi:MAG TPA: serine/threonine-protein kinase [Kofleriaceae bacterium]|jgi:tetratricopeptide (TPR) repeat protein|nr:serine/threonine-protein kinase [Kofleriaceae bacterium]